MDFFIIIIGVIVGLIGTLVISYISGSMFRAWNEDRSLDDDEIDNSGLPKTLFIGFIIFMVLGYLFFW